MKNFSKNLIYILISLSFLTQNQTMCAEEQKLNEIEQVNQAILRENGSDEARITFLTQQLEALQKAQQKLIDEQKKLLESNEILRTRIDSDGVARAIFITRLKQQTATLHNDIHSIYNLSTSLKSTATLLEGVLIFDKDTNDAAWQALNSFLSLGSIATGAYAISKYSETNQLSLDIILAGLSAILGVGGQYFLENAKINNIKDNVIRNVAFADEIRAYKPTTEELFEKSNKLYQATKAKDPATWKPLEEDLIAFKGIINALSDLQQKNKDIKTKATYLLSKQPDLSADGRAHLESILKSYEVSINAWDETREVYQKRHDIISFNLSLLP